MSTRYCYKYILEKAAVIISNHNVAEFFNRFSKSYQMLQTSWKSLQLETSCSVLTDGRKIRHDDANERV